MHLAKKSDDFEEEPSKGEASPEDYERLIESVQIRLKAQIFSMCGSSSDSDDILQETNRVLWRKREVFEEGTNFFAWAAKTAFFQVMSFRKSKSRSRLVFGTELTHIIADEMTEHSLTHRYGDSLEHCIKGLNDRQRQVIEWFYFEEKSAREIAETLGMKENAVYQILHRARAALATNLNRSSNKGK